MKKIEELKIKWKEKAQHILNSKNEELLKLSIDIFEKQEIFELVNYCIDNKLTIETLLELKEMGQMKNEIIELKQQNLQYENLIKEHNENKTTDKITNNVINFDNLISTPIKENMEKVIPTIESIGTDTIRTIEKGMETLLSNIEQVKEYNTNVEIERLKGQIKGYEDNRYWTEKELEIKKENLLNILNDIKLNVNENFNGIMGKTKQQKQLINDIEKYIKELKK